MMDEPTEKQIDEILDSLDDSRIATLLPLIKREADKGDAYYATMLSCWIKYEEALLKFDEQEFIKYAKIAIHGFSPLAAYEYYSYFDDKNNEPVRNTEHAFGYLILAAILGEKHAIYELSRFFSYGDIVEKNEEIANLIKRHHDTLESLDIKRNSKY